MFQPRVLIPGSFNYNDELTENQISNMRERAIQRAIQLQKEKTRMAKLSKLGS
jgi:phosphoribosylformylglycinamidine (FGAM) synthase-like amidotransferase family enzyme